MDVEKRGVLLKNDITRFQVEEIVPNSTCHNQSRRRQKLRPHLHEVVDAHALAVGDGFRGGGGRDPRQGGQGRNQHPGRRQQHAITTVSQAEKYSITTTIPTVPAAATATTTSVITAAKAATIYSPKAANDHTFSILPATAFQQRDHQQRRQQLNCTTHRPIADLGAP